MNYSVLIVVDVALFEKDRWLKISVKSEFHLNQNG